MDQVGLGVKWSFYPKKDYCFGLSDILGIGSSRSRRISSTGNCPIAARGISAGLQQCKVSLLTVCMGLRAQCRPIMFVK